MLKLVRPIISGEHPEAMQTGSSGCQYSWLTILMLMTMVFYYNHRYFSSNLTNCLLRTTCQTCHTIINITTTSTSSSCTAAATTATTRCIESRYKSFKTYNKTTATNNSNTTCNISLPSLHCSDYHHLLANKTNVDNNCCNQELVSTS